MISDQPIEKVKMPKLEVKPVENVKKLTFQEPDKSEVADIILDNSAFFENQTSKVKVKFENTSDLNRVL